MASTAIQVKKSPTACDRCYRLKERCTRQLPTDVCGRCDRLRLDCTTNRPPRQAGRRLKEPRHIPDPSDVRDREDSGLEPASRPYSSDATTSPLDIGTWINGLADLSLNEKEKLVFLLDRSENHKYYLVSPDFQDAERRSMTIHLPAALPVLKDAYLARAGALKLTQAPHDYFPVRTEDGKANLLHALAGMKTLRALPVSTPQEATLCLTLGVSLALFAYSSVGQGIYEISQYCLGVARPFVETGTLEADAEPSLTFLVLLELMDCIVYRRRPTIRLPRRRSLGSVGSAVDRYLGLCVPLLPYYHDLCMVSHSMTNTTSSTFMALVERQLDKIQAEVEEWQPSPPDDFIERFKSAEVVHLLAQAKLYRLAALLIGHRLRYKFGEHDEQAAIWANEMMSELVLSRRVTNRPARCVTLPFILAAIELRDPVSRSQALQNVDDFVDQFTPAVQRVSKIFLSRIWWQRDRRTLASWFDSTCRPCIMLASVDNALFGS